MKTDKKFSCADSIKEINNIEKCPVCNFPGEAVKIMTVKSLIKDEIFKIFPHLFTPFKAKLTILVLIKIIIKNIN